MTDSEALFVEVEISEDVRAFLPKRFTRIWHPSRPIDVRILWDEYDGNLTLLGNERELDNGEIIYLKLLEMQVLKGKA